MANVIFHHLVIGKRLSVNATDEVIHNMLLFATCAIFGIVWEHSSAPCLLAWKLFWSEMPRGTQG